MRKVKIRDGGIYLDDGTEVSCPEVTTPHVDCYCITNCAWFRICKDDIQVDGEYKDVCCCGNKTIGYLGE